MFSDHLVQSAGCESYIGVWGGKALPYNLMGIMWLRDGGHYGPTPLVA